MPIKRPDGVVNPAAVVVDHDVAAVQVPCHMQLADEVRWNVVEPVLAGLQWIGLTTCEALIERVDINLNPAVTRPSQADLAGAKAAAGG